MKLLKCTDACVIPLTDLINNIANDCLWPVQLGSTSITPAHKKSSRTDKGNYQPINVLPSVSEIFEKLLHDQLSKYMEDKLSPLLCGFRKKYSTQHALLRMIERWRHCLDNSGAIAAVLMDLSKAYNCIPHDLLIAKLYAYGLDNSALSLLHSYLSNRKQRVKVNNCFTDWINVIIGISQGSVLGPLLFNIFINDLFLTIGDNDLCDFADDNTLYRCSNYLSQAKCDIEAQCSLIIWWFNENSIKMNPEKCHALILKKEIMPENFTIRVGDAHIVPEHEVTLLGVTLDSRLKVNTHIINILKEVSKKVNALIWIAKYLNVTEDLAM